MFGERRHVVNTGVNTGAKTRVPSRATSAFESKPSRMRRGPRSPRPGCAGQHQRLGVFQSLPTLAATQRRARRADAPCRTRWT